MVGVEEEESREAEVERWGPRDQTDVRPAFVMDGGAAGQATLLPAKNVGVLNQSINQSFFNAESIHCSKASTPVHHYHYLTCAACLIQFNRDWEVISAFVVRTMCCRDQGTCNT